eukprot:scaffold301643_cov14-Tisochrysis_lutea.AAC.2
MGRTEMLGDRMRTERATTTVFSLLSAALPPWFGQVCARPAVLSFVTKRGDVGVECLPAETEPTLVAGGPRSDFFRRQYFYHEKERGHSLYQLTAG